MVHQMHCMLHVHALYYVCTVSTCTCTVVHMYALSAHVHALYSTMYAL